MESEKVSLLSSMKFSSIEKINDSFLRAKCYVMSLGKNVNKSYFEKENVDRAYNTLAYAPVIGHLMIDDNGVAHLGGHDYHLDLNDFTLKSQCVPFGVALPSETPVYEEVTEADGTVSTYLTCEVVLWISRYPELADAFYDESIFTAQSMEILYSKSEPLKEDTSYTNIIDFSFDALCMLQKSDDDKFNVQPCFPSASIVPITYSIDKNEFSSLMSELKEELTICFQNNSDKGGKNLDKKLEILQKFNKTVEDLNFSIEEMSEEELETKMEELFGVNEPEPVTEPVPSSSEPMAFSATYKEKRQALENALDPVIVKDNDGNYIEETYYWIEDFSDEYVFVEQSHWTADNYERKFGRFAYTFDASELTATLTSSFEEMVKVWLTLEEKANLDAERENYESLKTEYSEYKENHTVENSEYEELKTYKATKEAEERKYAEDTLFADYEETIGKTEEFKALKEKASEFSLDALKKECLCIVGMHSMTNKTTKKTATKPESIKFSLEKSQDDEEPYGGLMKKHLNR